MPRAKKVVKTDSKLSDAVKASVASIIKNPRITEKAAQLNSNNVYVFDIAHGANRTQVRLAVEALYGVRPAKVNLVSDQREQRIIRNKVGIVKTPKKAYVTLKKGDTIEF
ncbi:MAG TPA: 50S ribosomal protein L23 [Candidatus Paceibacterota bacterium]